MGTSSWLATILDQELLEVVHKVGIYARRTPLDRMISKDGVSVSTELGGRYLLYYVRALDVGRHTQGRTGETYTTPTPYSPEEAGLFLALPRPTEPRNFVLLIDPRKLPATHVIKGPRWTALGAGIEYVLTKGFTQDSVVAPPGASSPWEVIVR
jgi:hypothetical protein